MLFLVKKPVLDVKNPVLAGHQKPPFLPFLPGLENVPGPLFIFKPPPQRGFWGSKISPLVVLFRYIEGPFWTPASKFRPSIFPQHGHVAVATCPCCFYFLSITFHNSREKFLRSSKNFGSIVEPLRVVGPNMDKDVDHSSKWATSAWTMTLLMMKKLFIIKQPSSSLVNYTLSPCITKCLATPSSEVNER